MYNIQIENWDVTKVKKAKFKLNFIIYLSHYYKHKSLSKISERKDQTKLLFI